MPNSGSSGVFSNNHGSLLSPLIAQSYGLPEPRSFAMESFTFAFPQILAWCSAIGGILLVTLIVKSFLSRG